MAQCKQPWDMTNNANSSAKKIKIRRASFLLFSLSRHLNFWIEITYLDVYFSQKNTSKLKYFITWRPWKICTPAMNWSAQRQIRFCACTKMSMNRGDFRSLYQGLLIFHAPCTKKTLGTRLVLVYISGPTPRKAVLSVCFDYVTSTIVPEQP
jgi:hypothetical protein